MLAELFLMSQLVKCTCGCRASATVDSRHAALERGWVFVEASAKGRVRYHVLSPQCRPKWLAAVLGEPEKEKGKA